LSQVKLIVPLQRVGRRALRPHGLTTVNGLGIVPA
jgi:hypothetical protein